MDKKKELISKLKLQYQNLVANKLNIDNKYNAYLENFKTLSEEFSNLKKDKIILKEKLDKLIEGKIMNFIGPFITIIIYITIILMLIWKISFFNIILNVLFESIVFGAALAFTFNIFDKKIEKILINKYDVFSKMNNDIENVENYKCY